MEWRVKIAEIKRAAELGENRKIQGKKWFKEPRGGEDRYPTYYHCCWGLLIYSLGTYSPCSQEPNNSYGALKNTKTLLCLSSV